MSQRVRVPLPKSFVGGTPPWPLLGARWNPGAVAYTQTYLRVAREGGWNEKCTRKRRLFVRRMSGVSRRRVLRLRVTVSVRDSRGLSRSNRGLTTFDNCLWKVSNFPSRVSEHSEKFYQRPFFPLSLGVGNSRSSGRTDRGTLTKQKLPSSDYKRVADPWVSRDGGNVSDWSSTLVTFTKSLFWRRFSGDGPQRPGPRDPSLHRKRRILVSTRSLGWRGDY